MTTPETLLTIITPAYNEAGNIPLLYQRIEKVLKDEMIDWEWIVVDDHSQDDTFKVISQIAQTDIHIKGIRLARNAGSHMAIKCGLDFCQGHCAVVMAADLQDPPETIPDLIDKWQQGAKVVWAVREQRQGEKANTIGFSRLYYFIMRNIVGIREMPATGADFFLIDKQVICALKQFNEAHVSLLTLITWLGFNQDSISYNKEFRFHGKSGWTLRKKLKLVIDSVTAFSYFPIRFMSYFGFFIALAGFIYAGCVFINGLRGIPVEGWASMMIVILVIGGMQMLMLGILGEYLWRTLDESKKRPRYIIEKAVRIGCETREIGL
ncbi:MAG: glycosyltransferase family 2 protein [Deltaproteobacteria bacterium]|nr:glycosyltransferase family 2 protein [Deltaproteobacteria bacterium]